MNQTEFSESLKKAIQAGEVKLSPDKHTARILIQVMESPAVTDPEKEIGPILVRLKKHLGLKAELEDLGYEVESVDPAVANQLTQLALEKTYADHKDPDH